MLSPFVKSALSMRLAVVLLVIFAVKTSCAQDHKPCTDRAYPKGRAPSSEAAFDATYDAVNRNGWSFSCGPEIAASEARKALESFRDGILYHDKARLDVVLRYPLTVRINKTLDTSEEPKVVIVKNSEEWSTLQKQQMNKVQIALIACSWLGNVTVANGRSPGFFIGDGMVWFQSSVGSSKVLVTSINLMPLTPEMFTSSCAP